MLCERVRSVLDDLIKFFDVNDIYSVEVIKVLDEILLIIGRCAT